MRLHKPAELYRQRVPAQVPRLAIIVSHPIQYYVPLYQRLARRHDIAVKVFFTWHDGKSAIYDSGFQQPVAWDIPLHEAYEHEAVPNVSRRPITRFSGLNNPSLFARVSSWNPDAVHITGWAWRSHLQAIYRFRRTGIPVLFRGDSHLLDWERWSRKMVKGAVLRRVYSWPAAFLYVGSANRAYYEHFGVASNRLFLCPHSIDVSRFTEPEQELEAKAVQWRRDLAIPDAAVVALFAGKFEARKQPLEFIRAVAALKSQVIGVMVGGGEMEGEVKAIAAAQPARFRVLPFQNQSMMPVVYRLGDVFVLPSLFGETWGLAANEALACGRPVLVSNKAGCAADLLDERSGAVFDPLNASDLRETLDGMTPDRERLVQMRDKARQRAKLFDLAETERTLMTALAKILAR